MAIDASENRSRLIETGSNRQSHDVGFRPEHRRGGLLGAGGIDISFEFYPPSSPTREDSLWRSIRRLEGFSPINVAITDQGTKSTRKKNARDRRANTKGNQTHSFRSPDLRQFDESGN